MECKIKECTNKVKTIKSMLCEKHYSRFRRNGTTDKTTPTGFSTGDLHETRNHGTLEIINYVSHKRVIVRFIKTNHFEITHACSVKSGLVKDPFYPRVFGVGYNGIGEHKNSVEGKATSAYSRWKDMLRRCYCKKTLNTQSAYSNVTVCDEWHDFQNFATWFYSNYIDGFDLDKDLLSGDLKIYSPETCCFLSPEQNSLLAQGCIGKNYTIKKGDLVFKFYSINKAAKELGLCNKNLSSLINGRSKSYKGWVSE
tara:strand:+ start:6576 stop:7337 length:762 start_codon:yes stop_codon:yes gene_type:complete